jgi:hypothetical protein
MTGQPGTQDAQAWREQAQQRIDELVERNRELDELIAAIRPRAGDAGRRIRSTRTTVEQAKRSARGARDRAEQARAHAAQAHRRAALRHDQAARCSEEAATAGVGDPRALRARAAQHAHDAAMNRAQADRDESSR